MRKTDFGEVVTYANDAYRRGSDRADTLEAIRGFFEDPSILNPSWDNNRFASSLPR
jgi:hypothetical protein